MSDLLTTADIARELGVSERRVRALAAARNIGKRVGAQWIFRRADIERLRDRKPGRPRRLA